MLPTVGGNTLVFTGTLIPSGSALPSDTQVVLASNDPSISPTVDASGLVVTVPLPAGWVEEPTNPLGISYSATSPSNPQWSLSGGISPSAPPVALPTGITFAQTQ